jgi:molybdate transport system substrate-binding protein
MKPVAALRRSAVALSVVFSLCAPMAAGAGERGALVAVAANFAEAMRDIETAFEAQGVHTVTVTTGSTGKLYAQITKGAPFDVFLSADQKTPALLESNGGAVAGTRFTYAIGRLALWSADPALIGPDGPDILASDAVRHIAIANPELAPYGAAAREALVALKLWDRVRTKLVLGENVGQAFAMVASGSATAGFVAHSAVAVAGAESVGKGSVWVVPQPLFTPIRQDAVLLSHGAGNAAAKALLDFLKTPQAKTIMERHGYDAG